EGKGAARRPDRKGYVRCDERRDDVVRNETKRSKQEATMEPDRPAKTPPRLPFAAWPVPGPAKHCGVLPKFPVARKREPGQMVPRSPRPPAAAARIAGAEPISHEADMFCPSSRFTPARRPPPGGNWRSPMPAFVRAACAAALVLLLAIPAAFAAEKPF